MLRRLLLVALTALACAAPASAFSKQDGMQVMDDGVSLGYTLYTPDGAAPAGGWPGVVVLHGLAGTRGSVDAISTSFAAADYAVLTYDARGHGGSGGVITLAGPREVADLRAVRNAFAGRANVSDTKIGAWGISYGGGQIWNALAAGVPFAAAEVVETWTSLYDALWPQNLARSGIVAGFAASVAARSPLIASLRDAAVHSTNPAAIRELTAERSALSKAGSIRTPVYLFHGRTDFAFDISQATRAYARLAGPKRLYVGTFGHTPSTFPGPDIAFVLSEGRAWFDSHVKGVGPDMKPQVTLASQSGKLTKVDFKVNGVYTSAGTGQPRWRVLATPYRPGLGSPNAAGTVEAQSVIGFPRSATLRKPAVRAVKGFVTLRIGGAANLPTGAPASLRLYRGAKSASGASIVLRKSGNAYSGTLRIKQTGKAQVVFLQTRASVAAGTVPCTPTFGLPCLSATRAAIAVRSNTVRIVIPKRK